MQLKGPLSMQLKGPLSMCPLECLHCGGHVDSAFASADHCMTIVHAHCMDLCFHRIYCWKCHVYTVDKCVLEWGGL